MSYLTGQARQMVSREVGAERKAHAAMGRAKGVYLSREKRGPLRERSSSYSYIEGRANEFDGGESIEGGGEGYESNEDLSVGDIILRDRLGGA